MPAPLNPDARRRSPAVAAGSRDRTKWVPVSKLSAVARALLSDNLGGRDVVPKHVADRVTAQAAEWVEQGFTEETVRAWKDADVPPAAAAYLARRGVDPRVLDLPAGVFPGAAPVPLRVAIASGRLPVEQAYELLVLTGEHTPPEQAASEPAEAADSAPSAGDEPAAESTESAPSQRRPAPRPVAPVIFSHAASEPSLDDPRA